MFENTLYVCLKIPPSVSDKPLRQNLEYSLLALTQPGTSVLFLILCPFLSPKFSKISQKATPVTSTIVAPQSLLLMILGLYPNNLVINPATYGMYPSSATEFKVI